MNPELRLQSALAQLGVASRRAAAEWIRAGRVRVNGVAILEPCHRVELARDTFEVDGRRLNPRLPRRVTVMLNKPRGYVCSADRVQGRSVCDLVAKAGKRLVPVGRLDKQSEGLLLLSNDGDLVLKLTHPRYGHVKEYRVWFHGRVNAAVLKSLRAPIEIDGKTTRPATVEAVAPDELLFTLGEGRNHQIRLLCERAGLHIIRLVRTAVNTLHLPDDLPPGHWRELTPDELAALM